jgi:ribosomal protein L36
MDPPFLKSVASRHKDCCTCGAGRVYVINKTNPRQGALPARAEGARD